MFADLWKVAKQMQEESFDATIIRDREKIRQALKERGEYQFCIGDQKFTITLPREHAEPNPQGASASR